MRVDLTSSERFAEALDALEDEGSNICQEKARRIRSLAAASAPAGVEVFIDGADVVSQGAKAVAAELGSAHSAQKPFLVPAIEEALSSAKD